MAEPFTLYKLIILYMLKKVDFPLTNSQISEFVLDEGYTTYFKLQQAISELISSGFVREESTHSRTFYHLTAEGDETICYFKNDISPAIQHDIDTFLKEKQYELKNEVAVKSDYYQNSNMGILCPMPGVRAGNPAHRPHPYRAHRIRGGDDSEQLDEEESADICIYHGTSSIRSRRLRMSCRSCHSPSPSRNALMT